MSFHEQSKQQMNEKVEKTRTIYAKETKKKL